MSISAFPGVVVLDEINSLAGTLYSMHGKTVVDGFKFYAASCNLGRQCWNAAVVTYFNFVCPTLDISEYLVTEMIDPAELASTSTQPLVTY